MFSICPEPLNMVTHTQKRKSACRSYRNPIIICCARKNIKQYNREHIENEQTKVDCCVCLTEKPQYSGIDKVNTGEFHIICFGVRRSSIENELAYISILTFIAFKGTFSNLIRKTTVEKTIKKRKIKGRKVFSVFNLI